MIVLSDEYHASYTVNIHRVFPSLRRQTLEMHHHCLVAKLSGCAPLGEFNLTEAILKADFCFQINLTGTLQFGTSGKIFRKFQNGAPKYSGIQGFVHGKQREIFSLTIYQNYT